MRHRPVFLVLLLQMSAAVFPAVLRAVDPLVDPSVDPLVDPSADPPHERVIAEYTSTVTQAEFDEWLRFQGRKESSDRDLDLRRLIVETSMATEAERLGLDRLVETQLEIRTRDAELALAELRSDVARSIEISEAEADAKYEQIKDTFTMPRRVRLRNLFKRYPPAASSEEKAALRAEMEELRQRVVGGEDFGRLAADHSDSQTRFQNGLLGNVPAGTFDPEVDAIAMAMKPGEVSEILAAKSGLTLLYCEKILDKVVRSADELREIARRRLQAQTFKRHWADLQAEWQDAADPPSAVLQEAERRGLLSGEEMASRRRWSRRQILSRTALLRLVIQRFTAPTDDEARRYYEEHVESFVRPRHFDLAAILLPSLAEGEVGEIYRQGELLVHRMKTGELSFEEAARLHSRHPSAAEGGRVSWVSRPALPRVFGLTVLKAVLRLDPGEMSDLVQDGDHLWILRLEAIEEERRMTWDEAREPAKDELGTLRAGEIEAQVLEDRLGELDIVPSDDTPG